MTNLLRNAHYANGLKRSTSFNLIAPPTKTKQIKQVVAEAIVALQIYTRTNSFSSRLLQNAVNKRNFIYNSTLAIII